MRAKNSHSYDISLGQKIRFRRNMMGFSQKQLGSHLGVTFQQIQKYEKGLNRVSAARLQEIADVLKVPVSFFYAESTKKEEISSHFNDRISSKAEYLLLKNFRELTRKKQRAILLLISDEKNTPYFHEFTEMPSTVFNNMKKHFNRLHPKRRRFLFGRETA